MKLHVANDGRHLSENLASWISDRIHEVLKIQDRFTFVLSGGSTPKQLYALLSSSPCLENIPWNKLHFFWGDERAVPYDDERNNARMCFEELLEKVPVDQDQIHVMRTDLAPAESAVAYEKILKHYFGNSETTFDLVLLGMGDDGHTLSLFPGTPVIHETQKWVDSFFLPAQDMYRITLTAPVVNKARYIAFMAVGMGKAQTLKSVLEGETNLDKFPSQIIQPAKGELHWFIDETAAALLNK